MNTRLRIAVLSIAAAASAGLTACTVSAQDDSQATPNLADTITTTCDEIGPGTLSVEMDAAITAARGLAETGEQKSRRACDDYRSGTLLASLRTLPVTWDRQCLEGAGWTLSEDQTPLQLGGIPGHYYPAEVAHCGTPVVSSESCESVRQALAPNQAALNYETASVITKLGCTNIEVQMPS
ncbi:hypothetical protein DBV08_30675 [Rhodococcus sp. KBW08]|nr:hypothetical protein DBV08_30675 [Rhodococcus sp. KBW08]